MRAVIVLVCATAFAGCAGVRMPTPPWSQTAPEPPPSKAALERARAEELEQQGALREALAAWTAALVHEPGDIATQHALMRVRARIDREVADLLQRGKLAIAEARRHYAAAAALDPQSRPAQEALRSLTATEAVAREEPRPAPPRIAIKLIPPPPAVRIEPLPRDEIKRARLVQERYQVGLRLFREEKIEEAIAEWRAVLELDPRHPSARRNIEQAERILRTLAEEQQPLTATPR